MPQKNVKLTWVCLALAFLTVLAYAPVRHHAFIAFDDDDYVAKNYFVQQGLTAEGAAWAWGAERASNWHPLTWFSHMLDCELFGLNAGAHHLVNVFFHVMNACLLLLLLHKMTSALWRSAFVAALFALHPLHVESVAWVAERKDVLSAFFGLLTLWFYTRFAQKTLADGVSSTPRFSSPDYVLALVCFALGLMAKPMLVTIPCVLLLLDFWPLGRISNFKFHIAVWPVVSRLLLEKIPFFALTVVSCFLTYSAQKSGGAMPTMEQMVLSHRVWNALVAYVTYLGKTVWPRGLAVLYPVEVWPAWKIAGATLALASLFLLAGKMARRRPYVLVGWLWYFGMLVPVIGLVHVGSQSMADRYTYLPLIGIFILVAWGAFDFLRWPKLLWGLALVVIGFCFNLTSAQVALWRDSETLFRHTLRFTGHNLVIQNNLASQLILRGELVEAIALLEEAIALKPDFANSLSNLGSALERQGKAAEAIPYYERAVVLNPKHPEARNNLGFLLLMRGSLAEAVPHFMAAIQLRPGFSEPHYNLGNAYFMQGKMVEALPHYEAAVRFRPDYAEAQSNLGFTLLKLGRPEEALAPAQAAVRLQPELAQGHNNLAEIFLRLKRVEEAETHARQAGQLQPNSAVFQNTLGLVLSAQKKWPEAGIAFARVTELQPQFAEGHYNQANALAMQQKLDEARQHYLHAVQLVPAYAEAHYQLAMLCLAEKATAEAVRHLRQAVATRPDWPEALNNLAWLLATSGKPDIRDGSAALMAASKVLQLQGENAATLDTLAAAQAESGRFQEAVLTARQALARARATASAHLIEEIQHRLELYESGQAYREQ